MGIYFVLYGLIFGSYFYYLGNKKSKKKLYIFVFTFLILMMAFRHPSMGKDLGYNMSYGYLYSYKYLSELSLKEVIKVSNFLNYEKGYIILNKIISFVFGSNEQGLLIICSLLSLLPIAYTIFQKSKNVFLSMVIFVSIPNFLLIYSGLRQSIALGICFFSIRYIEKKQWVKFFLLILLAAMFHRTALVFGVAYFVYQIKMNFQSRLLTVVALPIIFLLRYPLFNALSRLIRDDVEVDNNGSIMLLLVFVLIYVFCFVFTNNSRIQNGYMNLLYLACICQVFGNIYNTALRVGYYFLMFIVLLLPDVFYHMKATRERLVVEMMVANAFILFGLYNIYTSSWAMAYPYYWFFERI